MVNLLLGLMAACAALANVLLVSALAGPLADRLDGSTGRLGLWLALAAALLLALAVPLWLARTIVHRLRDLRREPRTGPLTSGVILGWSLLLAGLVWLGAPQPLPRFFAEHGHWLTSRLWNLRVAAAAPAATPASAPPSAQPLATPPTSDEAAFSEARATLVRFLEATRTLELQPEMSNESAAAMGARWLKLMHGMFSSLWSDEPELGERFDTIFEDWEITPAMFSQPAKLKAELTDGGREFLADVNALYVELSTLSKNPAGAPDNAGLGVALTKSCYADAFHFDVPGAVDKLGARRVSPTVMELYDQHGAIPLLLEEGLWRVHLAPFDTLYALPILGHGLGMF